MDNWTIMGLLIPAMPILAFLVIVAFTRRLKMTSAIISISGIATSFIISVIILVNQFGHPLEINTNLPWLYLGELKMHIGVMINPLTSIMLIVVTSVSMLVQIYSIGYMKDDPGFSKFFAFLSLFSFSMLGIVLANNL